MLTRSTQLAQLVAAATVFISSVASHGILTDPKPDFSPLISGFTASAPCGLIDGPTALPGNAYNQGADGNAKLFTDAFKSSSYSNLKDFVVEKTNYYSKDKECGFTDPSKTSATLPDLIEFQDRPGEPGFYFDHQGPCELWCDDERVFQDDNCAKTYREAPARLPYEKAKCAGKKKLTFVWLAVHNPEFQVYINCVGLKQDGGNNGGNDGNDGNGGNDDNGGGDSTSQPPTTMSPSPSSSPSPSPSSSPSSSPSPSTPSEPTKTPKPDNKPKPRGCRNKYRLRQLSVDMSA